MIFRQKILAAFTVLGVTAGIQAQYVAPAPNQKAIASLNQAAALSTAQTQAYSAGLNAGQRAGYVAPAGAPYGGYGYAPYGGYGGPLQGVAAVTNANAQYQVTIQQARMAQTQADMSKLDLRRRIKEEDAYERMMTPTPEQVRIADMNASLGRSRTNPPPTEIWSGLALNDLLTFSQTLQRQGLQGPYVPLTEDVLRKINVTTGTTQGSTGALNDGKPLKWPLTLKRSAYKDNRDRLQTLVQDLYKQAGTSDGVDGDSLVAAKKTLTKLEDQLRGNIADLTPDEYIGSKRFLSSLSDTLKTLEDPNASNYVTKKWSAKGNTVAELVNEMTKTGLKFAPAVSGDEPYYTVLHSAMLTYDSGLQSMAGGPPPATVRAEQPPPPQR